MSSTVVVDICIILFALAAGMGPYVFLLNFTNFSHGVNLLIAITSRLLSLAIYRWRRSISDSSPSFEIFEWVFPAIFMAEVAFLIPDDVWRFFGSNSLTILTLDIFTLVFLSLILGHTHLGIFGTIHLAVCQCLRTVFDSLYDAVTNLRDLFGNVLDGVFGGLHAIFGSLLDAIDKFRDTFNQPIPSNSDPEQPPSNSAQRPLPQRSLDNTASNVSLPPPYTYNFHDTSDSKYKFISDKVETSI